MFKEFFIVMVALMLNISGAHAQSNSPPWVHVWDAGGSFGNLRGDFELSKNVITFGGWLQDVYTYRRSGGAWTVLSASPESVNACLSIAVDQENALKFLDEDMAKFLRMVFGGRLSYLIDHNFFPGFGGANEKLKGLIEGGSAKIFEGNWIIAVNIATARGGVERWEVAGKTSPLQIKSFNRSVVYPPGWYDPPVITGN